MKFLDTLLEKATEADNSLLRESYKLRTVVNTGRVRHIQISSSEEDLQHFDKTQWRYALGIVELLGF